MRLHVLATIVGLVGCGVADPNGEAGDADETSDSDETGDGDGDEPSFPDIDHELWCGQIDSPALDVIDANHYGLMGMGPCGHVVSSSWVDGVVQTIVTRPDGQREALALGGLLPTFDATGQMLQVYDETVVELHDLAAGTARMFELDGSSSHGFVRSSDPEHPSVAWICNDDAQLSAVTIDQTTELMANVLSCDSVVGSAGSSKLLAVDVARLVVIDVESGEQFPTDIDDFSIGLDRSDELEIDYSGSLALHQVVGPEPDVMEDPAQIVLESRVVDLVSGEVVEVCESADLLQASTEHAPSFVVCDDKTLVWFDGQLVQLNDAPSIRATLASSGTLVFFEVVGEGAEILRVSATSPTVVEPIATVQSQAGEAIPSPNGDAIVHWQWTEICADSGCTDYLHEIRQWSVQAGLRGPILSAGAPQIGLVFEDGSLLAWSAVVEGPIAGPLPTRALQLIDVGGEVTRQWDLGANEFRDIYQLADGRLLVDSRAQLGELSLSTIDLTAPTDVLTHVAGPLAEYYPVKLDGLRRRVAFDTDTTLYWGTI